MIHLDVSKIPPRKPEKNSHFTNGWERAIYDMLRRLVGFSSQEPGEIGVDAPGSSRNIATGKGWVCFFFLSWTKLHFPTHTNITRFSQRKVKPRKEFFFHHSGHRFLGALATWFFYVLKIQTTTHKKTEGRLWVNEPGSKPETSFSIS